MKVLKKDFELAEGDWTKEIDINIPKQRDTIPVRVSLKARCFSKDHNVVFIIPFALMNVTKNTDEFPLICLEQYMRGEMIN